MRLVPKQGGVPMPISRSLIDKHGVEHTVWVDDEERQRCQVWSRVMGYFRPVEDWNPGKVGEWKERKFYGEPLIPELQPSLPGTQSP